MATATLGNTPTTLEDAEATTGWTFTSIALDGDLKKQGSNSVFGILRNDLATASWDIITDGGSAQNMTGRHVRCYIWFNSVGLLDTEANNGMEFFMYDGTNTAYWVVFGSDTYDGGWFNLVLDCDSTPDSGSFDKTIVRAWGFRYNRTAAPRNVDNTWIDYLRYGAGYYATGGTSGDPITLADIVSVDSSNGYGIIELIDGVYFSRGELQVGNGATTTWFEMDADVLVYVDAPVASTLYKLIGDGSGCRVNIVNSVVKGAGAQTFALDMDEANIVSCNIDSSLIARAAACDFKSGQTIKNNLFDDCEVITPAGADMRGSTVQNYAGTAGTAALVWGVATNPNALLDSMTFIKGSSTCHAIEFSQEGSKDLVGVTFSGYGAIGANDAAVLNSLSATTVDSYSESNQDAETTLYGSGTYNSVGQEFSASAGTLNACRFHLRKVGSPTGNAFACLYATDAGSPAEPTGAKLATSQALDVSTLTGTLALVQFDFGDQYELSAATNYFIAIEYAGGDGSNNIRVGEDATSPSHGGNIARRLVSTGLWSGNSSQDAIFYVYRDGGIVLNISAGGTVPNYRNVNTGASTVVSSTVSLTVTVQDESNAAIQNAQVSIHLADSPFDELMNEDTLASGIATEQFNYPGSEVDIVLKVRKSETTDNPRYFPFSATGTITSSGFSQTVTLEENTYV